MADDKQLTIDELARRFCVTEKAVRGWIADGMPTAHLGRQGRGRRTLISLCAAVEWWFEKNQQRLELIRQQTRLLTEQADKTAMDNRQRRAGLAPMALIEREVSALRTMVRTNALAILTNLEPVIGGSRSVAEWKAALEKVVFEFLDKSAVWEPGARGSVTGRKRAARGG